ncbi:hypothetical protein [[Eubacterium] cellulosolvens]
MSSLSTRSIFRTIAGSIFLAQSFEEIEPAGQPEQKYSSKNSRQGKNGCGYT